MKVLIVIALLLYAGMGRAQVKPVIIAEKDDQEKIFTKVEIEVGPKNAKDWNRYLQRGTRLPDSLARVIPSGKYRVDLEFIVDKDGYLNQVKALTNPGYGLAQRAVKLVRNYSGDWQPASQCGRNVKSYQRLTLIFQNNTDSVSVSRRD